MNVTSTGAGVSPFASHLEKRPANYQPLTPLDFLRRSAAVYPDKTAVIHGQARVSYATFYARCRRLAGALAARGLGRDLDKGDTVAILSPNTPAMLEAHYGVPMAGCVLNTINIRLDAAAIAFILDHGEARVLLVDREFSAVMDLALAKACVRPLVIRIDDALAPQTAKAAGEVSDRTIGGLDYEEFLSQGRPDFEWQPPADEWRALALNYTSGTTGKPKGVVYHHRGAYLNALGNVIMFGLGPGSVYLWTLPMFHCNGWTYTWAVTAAGGTHVCLRTVDPALIFPMIRDLGVTHLCGAPIVLNMLVHALGEVKVAFPQTVRVNTGGAAPPGAVIEAMEKAGFDVTHAYGLTETYGPSTFCAWQDEWDGLPPAERTAKLARQGVGFVTLGKQRVADPRTLDSVPADGKTMGEVMLRGSTVMKGYLKDPAATEAAFKGGWFRTGDLGVVHPDGYMEIKDRSKDIILSGGENISSLEIEEVLYRHPGVLEAAVVARPDDKWGESPCAFVALKDGADSVGADGIITWCRDNMAHYKCPHTVVFGPLPKTSTGKIQKYVLRRRAAEI